MISFRNGKGIRALTEYAQYYAPINNNELLYQFAGLTDDEKYYIIAILPINAPFLAENEKPDAPVPTDGVPIPTDIGPNDGYYAAITEKLVALDSESFMPSLTTLDALIQSILITTPLRSNLCPSITNLEKSPTRDIHNLENRTANFTVKN